MNRRGKSSRKANKTREEKRRRDKGGACVSKGGGLCVGVEGGGGLCVRFGA